MYYTLEKTSSAKKRNAQRKRHPGTTNKALEDYGVPIVSRGCCSWLRAQVYSIAGQDLQLNKLPDAIFVYRFLNAGCLHEHGW
jgi:hypothetical protein